MKLILPKKFFQLRSSRIGHQRIGYTQVVIAFFAQEYCLARFTKAIDELPIFTSKRIPPKNTPRVYLSSLLEAINLQDIQSRIVELALISHQDTNLAIDSSGFKSKVGSIWRLANGREEL